MIEAYEVSEQSSYVEPDVPDKPSAEAAGDAPGFSPSSMALDLASSTGEFTVRPDRRPFIPPPPPVELVTVDDARLPSSVGWERDLDAFYVGILQFERDAKTDGIAYKAENFRIVFDLIEGPVERDDLRMLGIVVKSLGETAQKFRDAGIECSRERGLVAGEERLVLMDPAGNWLRITQRKPVM
jgi:hypothetical protein